MDMSTNRYDNPCGDDQGSVSVIIPAYNEETSIGACLRSLREQGCGPLEIIVVDDGSTDGTVAMARSFGVTVLRQDHRGMAASRNLGARRAGGTILVMIDADMILAPDYVERITAPIRRGETVATDHWNERVANWDNPWARCQTWVLNYPDGRRQPVTAPPSSGQYRAVTRDFFLNCGGLTESEGYRADTSIARRTGVFAAIVEDAICYHRNIETPGEVFREARWHGRQIAYVRKGRLRRCIVTALRDKNPLRVLARGFYLALVKREPRMLLYVIYYTAGFDWGMIDALFRRYYQK